MRSRNLILLLAGVAVALVTLLVSWRFGVVFFLLPLFFVWSWGGAERADRGGESREGDDTCAERSGGRADEPGRGDAPATGDEGPGPRPPSEPGLDGEGI